MKSTANSPIKLSDEKREFVRNHVSAIVEFRETLDEVTDHLITAWETNKRESTETEAEEQTAPSENELLAHINKVIDEDFGGWYDLLMQEHSRSEQYIHEYRKEQFSRLKAWLRVPYIWAVLTFLSMTMYFSKGLLPESQLNWILFLVLGIPMFSSLIYLVFNKKKKESIRQKAILKYSLFPYHFLYTSMLVLKTFLLENDPLTGYSWSFVYAAVLLTLSLILALNAVAMVREHIQLSPLKTVTV